MTTYVYNLSDGSLHSWSPTDTVADDVTLAANGFGKVADLPNLDATHAWDATQKTVVTVVAPVKPNPIATGTWILRFTPQEFQAIAASTDATVQQFMYALNHTTTIDLNDPAMMQGVDYLVSINLLASSRVVAVMA